MPPTSKRRKPTSNANRQKNTKTSRGLVRIIAGQHRGRRLPVLIHEGLRPTGDRVKETLFNWLMSSVNQANCLDMFAGSGSLGIEALSRGAKHTVFIEQEKQVAMQIEENVATLRETQNATVINASVFTCDFSQILLSPVQFDIVFIDPPFSADLVVKSIEKLQQDKLLAPDAQVYIETGHNDSYQVPEEFTLVKQMKTSQVFACLYTVVSKT